MSSCLRAGHSRGRVCSTLAGAPCRTMTGKEFVQTSCGILLLIEYVQLTIPAGAFNRICLDTEGWGILEFRVCPVPPRTGALYRFWMQHLIEYVQLTIQAGAFNRICPASERWGILIFGVCPVPPRTRAPLPIPSAPLILNPPTTPLHSLPSLLPLLRSFVYTLH